MIFMQYFSDFFFFFDKSICCWYLFELPQSVEAIQMSTSSICIYKEVDAGKLQSFTRKIS